LVAINLKYFYLKARANKDLRFFNYPQPTFLSYWVIMMESTTFPANNECSVCENYPCNWSLFEERPTAIAVEPLTFVALSEHEGGRNKVLW